jgi:hypothetical protein
MSRQDPAYLLEVVHELLNRFEVEWDRQQSSDEIDTVWVSTVMFLLVSCFGGMRGYEVVCDDITYHRYIRQTDRK